MTPVDQDVNSEGQPTDAFFDEILAADLTGPWNAVRAFLPRMGPGGRIVLVSSVLGRFGVPGYGAYCAAKHGVHGLAKALTLELIGKGIVVNALETGGGVDVRLTPGGAGSRVAAHPRLREKPPCCPPSGPAS
jgi:NAD(P)-dependent dehydrogenase (short-subunit alcohol dehydrogenase family)